MSLEKLTILKALESGAKTFHGLYEVTDFATEAELKLLLKQLCQAGAVDSMILAGGWTYYMLPIHGQAQALLQSLPRYRVDQAGAAPRIVIDESALSRLVAHVMRRLPRLVPRRKRARLVHLGNRFEVLCDRNLTGDAS